MKHVKDSFHIKRKELQCAFERFGRALFDHIDHSWYGKACNYMIEKLSFHLNKKP